MSRKKRPRKKKKRKPLQKSASKPTINDCRQRYDISESAQFCSTALLFGQSDNLYLLICFSVQIWDYIPAEFFSVRLAKVYSVMSHLPGRFFQIFVAFLHY